MAKKNGHNLFDRLFRRGSVEIRNDNDISESVDSSAGVATSAALSAELNSLMNEVYPEFKDKFDRYAPDGMTEFSLFRAYCSEAGLLDNDSFGKLRAFIKENEIDCFGRDFDDAFFHVTQDYARVVAAQKDFEKDFKSVVVPAQNLPKGWEWVKYDDGSGSLNSPSGESYFSYDCISYGSQGGIEYEKNKTSGYNVFWGSFDNFVDYAETSIAKERSFLGKFDVPGIAGTMECNAWNCIAPTTVRLVAGDNNITIEGYGYEPSYEYFSATFSVSLNGEVLYGVDSRNVAPYRNEIYQVGKFDNFEDAIDYIREQIDGLEICLDEGPEILQDKSGVDVLLLDASAVAEKKNVSSEIEKSYNAVAFEK